MAPDRSEKRKSGMSVGLAECDCDVLVYCDEIVTLIGYTCIIYGNTGFNMGHCLASLARVVESRRARTNSTPKRSTI